MTIVVRAIEFATEHFKNEKRKGTQVPYMVHLFNVCQLLAERNCREEILAAALLHDIVEDTAVTIEEVEEKFGKEVATLVAGATEIYKIDKTLVNSSDHWLERKKHTIQFIKEGATIEQRLIIMADKIDNSRSLLHHNEKFGGDLWGRFNKPKPAQQWYYTSLVDAFEENNDHSSEVYDDLLLEFKSTVSQLFKRTLAVN